MHNSGIAGAHHSDIETSAHHEKTSYRLDCHQRCCLRLCTNRCASCACRGRQAHADYASGTSSGYYPCRASTTGRYHCARSEAQARCQKAQIHEKISHQKAQEDQKNGEAQKSCRGTINRASTQHASPPSAGFFMACFPTREPPHQTPGRANGIPFAWLPENPQASRL